MDPDKALRRVRELTKQLDDQTRNGCSPADIAATGYDLAVAFEVLDRQLSDGGYLPHAWASRFGVRHEVKP